MKKLIIILITLVLFGCNNTQTTETKRTAEHVFLDCPETDILDKQEAIVFASVDSTYWISLDTVLIQNTIDIINNAGYKWYRVKFIPNSTATFKTHVHYFAADSSSFTRKETSRNINTSK